MRGHPLPVRLLLTFFLPSLALAATPHRSWYSLPSSNGWGAVVADLSTGRVHHWREHLYATEEPRWDAAGLEVWDNHSPVAVAARDLLGDLDFAVIQDGVGLWLRDVPIDLDSAGWESPDGLPGGGTAILRLPWSVGDLRLSLLLWAPWDLPRSSLAAVLLVENLGPTPVSGLTLASRHDLHLGPGRPGAALEIGDEGESAIWHGDRLEERGFAGVTGLVPLGDVNGRSITWPGGPDEDPWQVVTEGNEFGAGPDESGVHDGVVTALSWNLATIGPGQGQAVGFLVAHHGDPFAWEGLSAEIDTFVGGRDALALLADERTLWAEFQGSLSVPPGLTAEELALLRQGAVTLRMAQVREDHSFVREVLADDSTPRYRADAVLPADLTHRGRGAILASLPPGQWTYAWPRDGAYAIAAMSWLGMLDEAEEGLRFLLEAESGRFLDYQELADYPMVPYQVSLCRHHGFGIEESDTSGDGDFNFEFDGPGLLLWSLRQWVDRGGNPAFLDAHWETLRDRVGGFLLALQEDEGLLLPDSSIWEHHWLGRERHWAYTDLVAARGLCDGALLADRVGDAATAASWRSAAERIREGILADLTDEAGVIASTTEELMLGHGYTDAATVEAASMGLFDPSGRTSPRTVERVLSSLRVPGGEGLARNDDASDAHGLSPWGSSYDSDEWVMIDLRAAVAAREIGLSGVSDALITWVTEQSAANFLAIGETYDSSDGDYTNNAPMAGFGAGAYALALFHRAGELSVDPACGEFPVEPFEATPPDPEGEESTPPGPTPSCGGCASTLLPGPAVPWTAFVFGWWRTRRAPSQGRPSSATNP